MDCEGGGRALDGNCSGSLIRTVAKWHENNLLFIAMLTWARSRYCILLMYTGPYKIGRQPGVQKNERQPGTVGEQQRAAKRQVGKVACYLRTAEVRVPLLLLVLVLPGNPTVLQTVPD
eukprot:224893-Rhodomonas_salina.1